MEGDGDVEAKGRVQCASARGGRGMSGVSNGSYKNVIEYESMSRRAAMRDGTGRYGVAMSDAHRAR